MAKTLGDKIFEKFDRDNNGRLDLHEFQNLLYNMEHAVTSEEAKLAFKLLDRDGNGTMDIKEFKTWWGDPSKWEKIQVDPETLNIRKSAAHVFAHFDTDMNGVINTSEFESFYQYLIKEGLTQKDFQKCKEDLDSNYDGEIQFSEYVDWLYRQHTVQIPLPGIADDTKVTNILSGVSNTTTSNTPPSQTQTNTNKPHELIAKKKDNTNKCLIM